jgi:asparagine synthase (glutamine-hydrolysing)
MCGICGILYDSNRPVDPEVLLRMTRRLAPRGPDDEGTWRAPGIGLGHRRLAVIDPTAARQPMVARGERAVLVYNGEIYNFAELARELEQAGHRLVTRSDTEVLLCGYLEWGPRVVERCNGMFSFALWDPALRQLLLARDRLGQKPLYCARIRGGLLFASELKALVVHPEFESRLAPEALRRYLIHEYVPDPDCVLEGVYKLPPGHLARVSPGDREVRARAYWSLPLPAHRRSGGFGRGGFGSGGFGSGGFASLDEAAEELAGILGAAVARRMVSDVPLGVFLSGGIDSSSIVGLLSGSGHGSRGGGPLQTFCIGFNNPSFDESAHARRVARHFGTQHRVRMFDIHEMSDLLPTVADFLDEPFGDASILPTHLLARFTREHVTVALSGDGGDELFAGYPTFVAEPFGRPLSRHLGRGGRRLLQGLAGRLPVSRENISFDFRVKQFLRGVGFHGAARHQAWLGSFLPQEVLGLLTPELRELLGPVDPLDEVQRSVAQLGAAHPMDRLLAFYCRYYLAGDILVKADRASMAVGLEVRAPLLDPEVVAFACRIPPRYRMRGLMTKAVCRVMASRLLPPAIARRPKKGFGIPVAHWLRGPLRPLMEELLGPQRLRREGYFRVEPVRRLVEAHLAGRVDARKPLWTLMAFQLWRERHLPGGAVGGRSSVGAGPADSTGSPALSEPLEPHPGAGAGSRAP